MGHTRHNMIRPSRRLCAMTGVTLLSVLTWSVTPILAGGSATEAVRTTINEVVRILSDSNLKKPDRAKERRKLLEKVIGDRFGYDEMAKRSLGAPWAKLNDSERSEFVSLFQALLTNSYADKIEGYSGEQVQYLNERQEEDYAEVRTKLSSGKAEIPMDYRLINRHGDWRVYDVVVDGVSLVSNYRGQFNKIIRSSSYEDLVKQLREKSDKFEKVTGSKDKQKD